MRSVPVVVRWLFVALGVWVVAYTTRNVVAPQAQIGPLFGRFAHDVVLGIAGLLCLSRAVLVPFERRPWALIGLGVLAWTFGETYYTAVLWNAEEYPIPSPADYGYLLMYLLVVLGLIDLFRSRTAAVPSTLRADGVAAGLAVGAISAAAGFEPVQEAAAGDALAIATSLAYPILDLLLIGFVVGTLAGSGWRLDRTWALIAAGTLAFCVANASYLVRITNGTYDPDTVLDSGWWCGMVLLAAAAWQSSPRRRAEPAPEGARLVVMPLLFGSVGLGLLMYSSFSPLHPLAVGLAGGALLAVMVRVVIMFGDHRRLLEASRREALTDSLTGLANRRALARHLERAIPDASDASPLVLALFDLDGFKLYNDTFGHAAGDALLVRMAGALSTYLGGRGEAFRMGGDEFCAVFEPGGEVVAAIVEGASAALSERGEGFVITSSWGAILLPREAQDAAEALRVADQRMYLQKSQGRTSASRQSRDVLLRALAERNPELSTHLDGVAVLAAAVARRLAVGEEEVEKIRHAAELHDVGKVAIPDDVLNKPGPLNATEWQFMRRHTLIGERIIAAAPALAAVAAVVRSSHERWDGTGYPDGLAGQAIPLGARIVAVADAFDAMTAARPYSPPRTPPSALSELRSGAGSQFDPVVVEAFCAVWSEQGAAVAATA